MWLLFCHKPWLTYLVVDCSEKRVSAEARGGFYFVTNHGSHTSEWTAVRIVSLLRQVMTYILSQTMAQILYLGVDWSENSVSAEARGGFYFVTNHGSNTSGWTAVRRVSLLRQEVACLEEFTFILSQTMPNIPRSGLQ